MLDLVGIAIRYGMTPRCENSSADRLDHIDDRLSERIREGMLDLWHFASPAAARISAVYTIVNDDGVLTGFNTDYTAIQKIVTGGVPLSARICVFGNGGVAKAIVSCSVIRIQGPLSCSHGYVSVGYLYSSGLVHRFGASDPAFIVADCNSRRPSHQSLFSFEHRLPIFWPSP